MSSQTLILILLSGIIALLVALFQYKYKAKLKPRLANLLTALRFLSIFAVLLLLVNPKFEKIKVYVEKPTLVIAVDNSNSIAHLKQTKAANTAIAALKNNKALKDKFTIEVFGFEDQLNTAVDSFNFKGKETNIDKALVEISKIHKTDIAPIVLISDGNQSFGNDYSVPNPNYTQPIYPVILGDTVNYTDLKIKQLNTNRYVFLKNKFPVEAVLLYQGNTAVTTKFKVLQNGIAVYSSVLKFSKSKNAQIINFTLPANTIGVQSYKAILEPLENEKNKVNNVANFAVEVIDQKTKIAIVSAFSHPDIGAFKKSIEANEQRSVTLHTPNSILPTLNDYQLIVLYQPDFSFKQLYTVLDKEAKNRFTIVGSKTNLRFINQNQERFYHGITNQTEDYQPKLNLNFSPFLVDDINFESFPPLKSHYGDVKFNVPFETILEKTVLGISNNAPLLATLEANNRREAVLFGENIWRWRAQSFINDNTFNTFDDFMGKMVQYLASSKRKERLNVSYKSFYTGTSNLIITAQIFDKNYQFDARQSLELILTDIATKAKKVIPFVLKSNKYQVDLSGLSPSKYNFTVKSTQQNISKSGSFEVLEYNIEQQFLNADITKLKALANHTKATHAFADNIEDVISDLTENKNYIALQKSIKNTIPLIDWKYLLAIMVFTLAAEWFLRKYNGLI